MSKYVPADEQQSDPDDGAGRRARLGRVSEHMAGLLSVSVLAGLLNVCVSLYLERPSELAAAAVAIQVASLSALFCLLLYGIVRVGLAVLFWLTIQFDPCVRAYASAPATVPVSTPATSIVVLTLGILTPVAMLVDSGGWLQDFVRFGFLGFAAVLAAGSGYLASSLPAWEGVRGRRLVRAFLMAAPLVGTLVFLTTWFAAFAAAPNATERFLLWLATGVLTAVALGVGWILSTRVSLQLCASVCVALLIMVAGFIVWSTNAPLELPIFDDLSGERPPHVILLTVDTLRADALGPRAGAPSSTPNIDELSAHCVVFDSARSPAPWTKPAVASMLTGLSPTVHEVIRMTTPVPEDLLTLAEWLQAAGYRTAAVGDNPTLSARGDFDQGFERYQMYPKLLGKSFGGYLVRRLETAFPSTAYLTDTAIDWVQANADDPFFLWLHYFDPHEPYAPPREYVTRLEATSFGNTFYFTPGISLGHDHLDAAEREWVEELYMGEVRYVDDNVGRFLEYLKAVDIFDDSLIIFSSDHGEEFWEHGGSGHGKTLYDEVIRVPLMIKLPGRTHTGHRQANVSTESIVPTILDILRLEAADAVFSAAPLSWAWQADGTDPMIPTVSTATLFFEDRISGVFGTMKGIHSPVSGTDELFDLTEDPDEKISLAEDHPELISEARRLISTHEALSLQIRQLLGLPTAGEGVLDPGVLEQLRALGYIQ